MSFGGWVTFERIDSGDIPWGDPTQIQGAIIAAIRTSIRDIGGLLPVSFIRQARLSLHPTLASQLL
jgi:hypothetical protein